MVERQGITSMAEEGACNVSIIRPVASTSARVRLNGDAASASDKVFYACPARVAYERNVLR